MLLLRQVKFWEAEMIIEFFLSNRNLDGNWELLLTQIWNEPKVSIQLGGKTAECVNPVNSNKSVILKLCK